jgi:hypothetical protein
VAHIEYEYSERLDKLIASADTSWARYDILRLVLFYSDKHVAKLAYVKFQTKEL